MGSQISPSGRNPSEKTPCFKAECTSVSFACEEPDGFLFSSSSFWLCSVACWDLSSPSRDQTCTHYSGNLASYPLACQESPEADVFREQLIERCYVLFLE